MKGGERERDTVKRKTAKQNKKEKKLSYGKKKGCSHSGLSGKIQSEGAGWRERINKAFFGETQEEPKGKECTGDVHQRTEYQAVKERTQQRTPCQRPKTRRTLPFVD